MFVKLMTTHHRYCNKSSKSFEIRVNSECNLSKKKIDVDHWNATTGIF